MALHSLEEQARSETCKRRGNELEDATTFVQAEVRPLIRHSTSILGEHPQDTVPKRLASFERTISQGAPFDALRSMARTRPISPAAKRRTICLRGKAELCRMPLRHPTSPTEGFTISAGRRRSRPLRQGCAHQDSQRCVQDSDPARRWHVTGTPTCITALHRRLDEVIEHYDRGGEDRSNLDPSITPWDLAQEKQDLRAVIKTLSANKCHPLAEIAPVNPQSS